MAKDISELISSLKKENTVILVGNKTNEEFLAIENNKEFYTRKQMVKEPVDYWNRYFNEFYNQKYDIMDYEEAIVKLINNKAINVDNIINFSYRGNLSEENKIINMNGSYNKLRCMQCNEEYIIHDDFFKYINFVVTCDKCPGKLSPTITMYGEKYKSYLMNDLKKSLFKEDEKGNPTLKVKNLIVIDADFNEAIVEEVLESFSALKAKDPSANLIIIAKNESEFINYHNADFATNDDIAASINRLIKLLEGE